MVHIKSLLFPRGRLGYVLFLQNKSIGITSATENEENTYGLQTPLRALSQLRRFCYLDVFSLHISQCSISLMLKCLKQITLLGFFFCTH